VKYDAVFGPYPSWGVACAKRSQSFRRVFPYRDRDSAMKDKEAFYRQIELAPDVTTEVKRLKVYRQNIGHIKKIFQG
jgi:hypothetical protein